MKNRTTDIASLLDRLDDATMSLAAGLEEQVWPEEMREAVGRVGDAPTSLRSRGLRGQGPLRCLHIARGTGAMESLTVLALPRLDEGRPIFAADLVAFRGRFMIVGVDLFGLSAARFDGLTPALEATRARLLSTAVVREAPEAWSDMLSDAGVFVREDAQHQAPLDAVEAAYLELLHAFRRTLSEPAPPAPEGRAWQALFLARMRGNRRESRALSRIFGDAWANRFLDKHFFAATLAEPADDESPPGTWSVLAHRLKTGSDR